MDWEQVKQEYPKLIMIIDYVTKHYPDDVESISKHKLVAAAVMNPEYSNTQIEDIIDKIAIFNGWKKWVPSS